MRTVKRQIDGRVERVKDSRGTTDRERDRETLIRTDRRGEGEVTEMPAGMRIVFCFGVSGRRLTRGRDGWLTCD